MKQYALLGLVTAVIMTAAFMLFSPTMATHAMAEAAVSASDPSATVVPSGSATAESALAAAAAAVTADATTPTTSATTATTDTSSVIKVQSSLQLALQYLIAAIGAGMLVVWHKVASKFKLSDEYDTYVEHAVTSGLAYAESKLSTKIADIKDPVTKSTAVGTAANFVLTSIPSLLAHFNITPDELRQMIADAFDDTQAATAVTATAATGTTANG